MTQKTPQELLVDFMKGVSCGWLHIFLEQLTGTMFYLLDDQPWVPQHLKTCALEYPTFGQWFQQLGETDQMLVMRALLKSARDRRDAETQPRARKRVRSGGFITKGTDITVDNFYRNILHLADSCCQT